MFIIDDIIIIGLAVASGIAASKGTTTIREFMNDGEEIYCKCLHCDKFGYHKFVRINTSWSGDGFIGFLGGAVGGTIKGVLAKKIYKCSNCGSEIYEDGSDDIWNADEGIDAFFNYNDLDKVIVNLQSIIASQQFLMQKYSLELEKLKEEYKNLEAENDEIKNKLKELYCKVMQDAQDNMYR